MAFLWWGIVLASGAAAYQAYPRANAAMGLPQAPMVLVPIRALFAVSLALLLLLVGWFLSTVHTLLESNMAGLSTALRLLVVACVVQPAVCWWGVYSPVVAAVLTGAYVVVLVAASSAVSAWFAAPSSLTNQLTLLFLYAGITTTGVLSGVACIATVYRVYIRPPPPVLPRQLERMQQLLEQLRQMLARDSLSAPERSMLEGMARSVERDIARATAARKSQLRRHTLHGQVLHVATHNVFSAYCVYRLVSVGVVKPLALLVWSNPSGDVLATTAARLVRFLRLTSLEPEPLAQQLSFVILLGLFGALVLNVANSADKLAGFFAEHSRCAPSVVAELCGVYTLATVFMLKASIPVEIFRKMEENGSRYLDALARVAPQAITTTFERWFLLGVLLGALLQYAPSDAYDEEMV